MGRILKILATIVVVLILAIVGLLVFLPTGQIVQLAADQVKTATGRDLVVAGDVSPSFFPVIGVEVSDVTLSNADWAEEEHMISAASAKIGVELTPLISGVINVAEIRLVDPIINLEVGADGTPNWAFEGQESAASGGATELPDVSLDQASVENGAVRYVNQQTGAAMELSAINADIGLPALDAPMTLAGEAVWNEKLAAIDLTLTSVAALLSGAETEVDLKLSAAPIEAGFVGALIPPGGDAPLEVGGDFSIAVPDPAAAMAWATGAEADPALSGVNDFNAEGEIAMDATALAVRVTGGASRDGEDGTLTLTAAGGESWAVDRAFDIDLSAGLGALAKVSFKGQAAAPDGGDPSLEGSYEVASANPSAAMSWAVGEADPALQGLSNVSLKGDIAYGADALSLTALGGAVRDGRGANVDLSVSGGEGWLEKRAFDVKLDAVADGLASILFDGAVAAPTGQTPTVAGEYDIKSADPAGALTWATGEAADPELAKIRNVALAGALDLSPGGLTLTAKGGAEREGKAGAIDLKAAGGSSWAESRAFDLALSANVPGLIAINYAGAAAAPVGAAPSLNGQLSLDAPDLRGLAALAGAALPAGNDKAFRRAKMSGSVSTPAAGQIALSLSEFQFDDIAGKGDVSAAYQNAISINANLTTGPLNLNPYLTEGETTEAGPGWSKERIDLSALSSVNGDFKIRAASVTARQAQLGATDIRARLSGGKLDLNINELGLYGGGVKGDIVVDGAKGNAVSANISASAVQLLPLLSAFAGVDLIEGLGALSINVSGGGGSVHDIMNSLNGDGSLKLTEGAIVGYNLAAMVRNITSAFSGGGGDQKTDFSEVSGTFDIRKGLLTNADFKFLGPLIRIVGEGDVDLGGQSMKFRLTPKAVTSLKGQGGSLDDAGLSFPLIVSGPWSSLSILPDLEAGIGDLLTNPEGALKAVEGLAKSVTGGDAIEGVAKALTGDGALEGAAAAGAAAAAVKAVTGGGDKSPVDDVVKAITGGENKASTKSDTAKKLETAQKRLKKARADGDEEKVTRLQKRVRNLKKKLKKEQSGGNVGDLVKGLINN
ncbi:MAG: AsmA family protein [Pseudomonadota bacterium]